MARADHAPRSRSTWRREVLPWLVQFAVALGLYFCFAAAIDAGEIGLGLVAAALAATASHVVVRERLARFAARWRWIAEVWRMPKYAVTGTWEIFSVLFRQLLRGRRAESLLLEVPFVRDADTDDSATRRALAAAYTTMTPNFVVLGFDEARGVLIFHQIRRSAIPEMTCRLGARP